MMPQLFHMMKHVIHMYFRFLICQTLLHSLTYSFQIKPSKQNINTQLLVKQKWILKINDKTIS